MSTGVQPGKPAGRRRTEQTVHRPSRRGWIAVWFIPVAFVVAMVLGEGLLSQQGYESADENIPFGVVAFAGGSALLVLEIPCVAAVILGRRAVKAGDPDGRAPMWIGAVLGALLLVQNLAALLLG